MRPTLVFSHANGYPAATYKQLFAVWKAAGWRVLAVEQFGHDPRYPVTSNWPHLRDQLIDFIADKTPRGAYLVGHRWAACSACWPRPSGPTWRRAW